MSDELSCVIVKKVRKNHVCEWCGEDIVKGESAQCRVYKDDAELISAYDHLECLKALEQASYDSLLVDDGFYIGEFKRGSTERKKED